MYFLNKEICPELYSIMIGISGKNVEIILHFQLYMDYRTIAFKKYDTASHRYI